MYKKRHKIVYLFKNTYKKLNYDDNLNFKTHKTTCL